VVTATASDPDGGSTVRKLLIDVAKANTDHLWIEVNGGVGSPYAINTSYEVEVQLRDSNDVLVAHDSTTQIFVLESTVPFEIDLDRDATWNEFPEDFGPKAVAGGIAFFDIRSSSVGTYQLYVYDTFGHSAVVSVTFA
jgi:ABC-type glycerol-3-phosphate transport system substrate-binding protein